MLPLEKLMIPVDQIEKQVMQKRMLSFKFIQYLYCFPGKPLYILFACSSPSNVT